MREWVGEVWGVGGGSLHWLACTALSRPRPRQRRRQPVRVEGARRNVRGARNCKVFSDRGRARGWVVPLPKSWGPGRSPGSLGIFFQMCVTSSQIKQIFDAMGFAYILGTAMCQVI